MKPPTVEEAQAYAADKGYRLDPIEWWAYWEARSWKAIKNWHACMLQRERQRFGSGDKGSALVGKPRPETKKAGCRAVMGKETHWYCGEPKLYHTLTSYGLDHEFVAEKPKERPE